MKKTKLLYLSLALALFFGASQKTIASMSGYEKVTNNQRVIEALEMLKGTAGEFSRKAILGQNLTGKPMKILFRNLGELSRKHAAGDALGWKENGQLYIFINQKHKNAPIPALASLLSHEALHQDRYNSISEETYAWSLEAYVWLQLKEKYPNLGKGNYHPLVQRENILGDMYKKANYTSDLIRQQIRMNPAYSDLPPNSPGFVNK